MPRQSFPDFLDLDNPLAFSPSRGRGRGRGAGGGRGGGGGVNPSYRGGRGGSGYSSPRGGHDTPGRGRGGGGGGGGRGRGGSTPGGSGWRGRGGASLKADYRAVPPIDYGKVNRESYKNMNGFTPSPHDNSTRPSTPRTPRQPPTSTPDLGPGPSSSSSTRSIVFPPSTPQAQHSSSKSTPKPHSSSSSPTIGTPDKRSILSSMTKSLYPQGTSHFTSSPFSSPRSALTPTRPGSTYTPGGGRSGGGGSSGWGKEKGRKVIDMGAPVFVKAGTLFIDDAHQPDTLIGDDQEPSSTIPNSNSNSGVQTPATHVVPGGTTFASSSLARAPTPNKPSSSSHIAASASESKDIDVVDNLVRGSTASLAGSDTGEEREIQEEEEQGDNDEGNLLVESFHRVNLGAKEDDGAGVEPEGMVVEQDEVVRVVEHETEVVVIADDEEDVTVMVDNTTSTAVIDVDADEDVDFAQITTLNEDDYMEDPEPAFYIDVNPSTSTDQPEPTILFDRPSTDTLLGDPASSSGEEEEIILVPRKHLQPEPIGVPVEPEYVRAKDEDMKPKESLVDKFGGRKGSARPVATTSLPSKGKSVKSSVVAPVNMDEGITSAAKGAKSKNKKQAKREKRKNKKEERIKKTEGIVRHKMPRMDSDIEWGSEGPPPAENDELVTDEEDDALPRPSSSKDALGGLSTKGLTGAKKREMELLMDYLENTVGVDSDEDEDDEEYSMNEAMPVIGGKKSSAALTASSMAAFVKGMSGANQVTIDDINDARQLEEEDDEDEDGWESSSGSELTDDEVDELAAPPKTKSTKSKSAGTVPGLVSQVDDGMDDSMEEDELEDSTDDAGAEMAGMGFGWAVPASSDTDSDDSDEDDEDVMEGIFNGKKTWADATDDFISAMDKLVDDNDLVMGSGKKFEKKKLFNAIQNGDFGDDWATKPAPKGKKNKLKGVPKELQAQWEKDRLKKAEKKRLRELERVEAQMSLYPAMRKQGKSKGKRNEIFAIDHTAGISARQMATMFDIDSDDSDADFGGYGNRRKRAGVPPVTDLRSLNEEIRHFMRDLGKTTMSLPAMDKVSRKKVHEMAECYSLKSQSKGKGKARFPVLIKTSRSSLEMVTSRSEMKLQGILGGARSNGDFYKSKYGKKDKPTLPGSTARTGAGTQRHRDGDAVGGGALAIGQDNIGHRLLSKMGWIQGDRIGRSGGLDVPIVAIVKNTKLGLGA